ncbi:recombinase family protein [Nocardia tengchongensis]|uniref:recombinase family protein n=1 Tax=Nocardia tengchongensis TaxID=2055889 RepID=UPI0036B41D0F
MRCSDEALTVIIELYDAKWSYRRIAAVLNEKGLSTPAGTAPWNGAHVHRLVRTVGARETAAALGKPLVLNRR